jgi:hypothetical protein
LVAVGLLGLAEVGLVVAVGCVGCGPGLDVVAGGLVVAETVGEGRSEGEWLGVLEA